MPSLGPVSDTLLRELTHKVSRKGILVWLDADQHYTAFVDQLVADPSRAGFQVLAFRGSHLELMLALETVADGVDRPALVIHAPGLTEDSIRWTPLYELYAAGERFRKKLSTLVKEAAGGKVPPEEAQSYAETAGVGLADADAWLRDRLDDGGGLRSTLRTLSLPHLIDDLLTGGPLAARLDAPEDRETVWSHLAAAAGLHGDWRALAPEPGAAEGALVHAAHAAHVASSWALAVEYTHDLQRAPHAALLQPATGLPDAVVAACTATAAHLRSRHPDQYELTALEVERWLPDEVSAAKAEDLGTIDTFLFEEVRVFDASLQALDALSAEAADWSTVLRWCASRLDDGSFWLTRHPERRTAWVLVNAAARLGHALATAGPTLQAAGALDTAVERYQQVGAAVDTAHRQLEEQMTKVGYDVRIPSFDLLRERVDQLREAWRSWADHWARDFNRTCQTVGFLGERHLQQRALFTDVVAPLTDQPGVTAYLMVDALRYEMAAALAETLDVRPRPRVRLDARLAELPTNTEIGMNLLAPLDHGGRLHPVLKGTGFEGFQTGEFRVDRPESRRRAIADRVGGETCPLLRLAEVCDRDVESLRRTIGRAKLLVVHSEEIDKAGEVGAGPSSFPDILLRLKAAWHQLREAGVRRFVFTSDHGFLLLREGVPALVQPHGQKTTPSRRHVLSPVPADHPNEVRVPLQDLGYDAPDLHLMMPAGVAVFDRGDKPMSFVHGGNSLQERVIPVLTVTHQGPAGSDSTAYTLTGAIVPGMQGLHCLRAKVEPAVNQRALGFGGADSVELVLRAADRPEVRLEVQGVRDGARQQGSTLLARVGVDFEVFFALRAPSGGRARVRLAGAGGGARVQDLVPPEQLTVTVIAGGPNVGVTDAPTTDDGAWLDAMPSADARAVFAHLRVHGAITEPELVEMLGSPRKARRLGARIDELARFAPFDVQVETTATGKRYLRS